MSHAVERIAVSDRAADPAPGRKTAAELRLEADAILRRNWRLILAATLATLLFGLAFALLSPAKYKSSAQLLVDPRGLQILKNDITRAPENADGNLVDVENQRYILLSRSILGAVVDREKLAENPAFAGGPGLMSRLLGRAQVDSRTRAMQTLGDMVEVVRGERAYVLDVVVTSKDPDLSAKLANVIARTFLDAQIEARSDAAKRASEDLSKRAEDLRRQVQKAGLINYTNRLPKTFDFTLHQVKAKDEGGLIFDTAPQFTYLIGYYSKKWKLGIEYQLDHGKYFVTRNQKVHMKGSIDGVNYDKDTTLGVDFFKMEHSDGANHGMINVMKLLSLSKKQTFIYPEWMIKGGIGLANPKTNTTINGVRRDDRYHISGYVIAVESGLRLNIGKNLYVSGSFKSSFVNYFHFLIAGGYGKQRWGSAQFDYMIGGRFPL